MLKVKSCRLSATLSFFLSQQSLYKKIIFSPNAYLAFSSVRRRSMAGMTSTARFLSSVCVKLIAGYCKSKSKRKKSYTECMVFHWNHWYIYWNAHLLICIICSSVATAHLIICYYICVNICSTAHFHICTYICALASAHLHLRIYICSSVQLRIWSSAITSALTSV